MTKHVFLMDVTRHRGPVQSLVETARAHAGEFDASQLHWFHLPQQQIDLVSGEKSNPLQSTAVTEGLKTTIQSLALDGADGGVFHVFSYDGLTLRDVASSRPQSVKVETQRYSQLKFRAGKPSPDRVTPLTRFSEPIPLDEAIQLAQTILREGGHTSASRALRQTSLRGLMTKRDERARKNPNVFNSKFLISQLVETGIREKWLGRDVSGKSGTESIWLVDPLQTEEKTAVRDTRSEAAKLAEAKTDSIVAALKLRKLYAPKDIRDLVFEALLQTDASGKTVTKLFREASACAEASAESKGISFDFWRPATESITNLAIKAGVLLDASGRAIPEGFASRGAIVSKVDPGVVDRCDACLITEMVRDVSGIVPTKDAPAIAHALFKKAPGRISQDDMIDRVHEVLAMLSGKLDQDSNGVLTLI